MYRSWVELLVGRTRIRRAVSCITSAGVKWAIVLSGHHLDTNGAMRFGRAPTVGGVGSELTSLARKRGMRDTLSRPICARQVIDTGSKVR
ncbi:hypothetical protein VTN77DRAFT_29 [Rasamsonia byssochlamydoides]|uniref:uncharacterized protein n=1 Tax=Rasamsonia byssochlamydoides TaxID=89139 RepID=UPI003742046D